MFKRLSGCCDVLSTRQLGVELQIYSGMIACMLRMLDTGQVPVIQTISGVPGRSADGYDGVPECRSVCVVNLHGIKACHYTQDTSGVGVEIFFEGAFR
jgi:hypothetical protein